MDVSVIIINYNTKDLTIDCIKSIFDSKTKYSYEVIVVDNASSDGSVEAIKHLFPQVTTIVNKVNVGFGRANNQAAAITTGRYLYLINSDTVIDANVIDRVVSYGDANEEAGVIGTRVVFPNGDVQNNFYKFPTLLSELVFFTLTIIKSFNWHLFHLNIYRKFKSESPLEVEVMTGCSMFVKREVYKLIGLFNDIFFMYYEDCEFCYRLKQQGMKCIYLPAATIRHFHQGSRKNEYDFRTLTECFKSACAYFELVSSPFQSRVFRIVCFLTWCGELAIFKLTHRFLNSPNLERKIVMLRTLISA